MPRKVSLHRFTLITFYLVLNSRWEWRGNFSVGYSCLILHCQSLDKIGFLAHHDFEDTFCELQSFSSSFLRVNIYSSVVEDNLDRRLLGQKLVSLCLSFFPQWIHIHRKENVFLALNVMVLLTHMSTYSLEFCYL